MANKMMMMMTITLILNQPSSQSICPN